MSYRLINANALAANCKQVNDMPCIYADLPNGLDGGYYNLTRGNADKSRYHELFGTPERAARTLLRVESSCSNYEVDGIKQSCVTCPLNMNGLEYPKMRCYVYVNEDYDALLEWLEQEAD